MPRYLSLNSKANEVNGRSMNMRKERNNPHIDHADTITPSETNLNESNLHLNKYEILAFAKDFFKYLLELN